MSSFSFSLTCLPRAAPSRSDSGVSISIDLLSSWGDEEEFGLTEVQVFDANGRWIILRADALTVEGAVAQTGQNRDVSSVVTDQPINTVGLGHRLNLYQPQPTKTRPSP